ncbi:xanthine dehydrogenase family protein molybdopterin-binding subunit [Lutimaribacter sp. EGI FJ00014]|nr:xanthine dehydrogenase family protein molybdopterin-binding subunit [Lutimaribacter sp. EGI FJ00014]
MPRREDPALLRGQGRFVGDLLPEGCLHLAFLRSPVAGGRIAELDLEDARAMPGVRAVYGHDDLTLHGAQAVNMLIVDAFARPFDVLAAGKVRAVGQPVAAVVAQTPDAALDAIEAIMLEIEDSPETAKPIPTASWQGGRERTAALTVEARHDHALVAPMALEPRACLAEPSGDGLRIWMSTQTPFRGRDDIARILGMATEKVQVIAPDVGGAFGGKASVYPEDVMVALAANDLGQPVKWVAARSDDFMAATQGRGARLDGALSVDAQGRLAGLAAHLDWRLGHWTPYSAYAPPRNAGRILPGPYDVGAVQADLSVRPTAGAAVNIYRGAGRPEAAMLMERLMDKAADALGLDPLEMRRRNVVQPGNLAARGVTGEWRDAGDYPALLAQLEQAAGYADLRTQQARRRAAGEIVGLGLALYIEPCGQGWETARISLSPQGHFVAHTGSSAQGQGRQTAWAQIVADSIGVPPDLVEVAEGDTADLPNGIGALASRSTAIGGSAMRLAAEKLRTQIAEALGVNDLATVPCGASANGAVCDWAAIAARLPEGARTASETFTAPHEAWASGAAFAQVAIDSDTGQPEIERIVWVDDAGRVINPLLVEGQLWGGLAQGLGCVLSERMVYDEDGQLLTGSLMDYAVPRATDMPATVQLEKCPTPSAANPLGVKGVGEAGCIAIPPAVLNALQDAVRPFTSRDLPIPATSEMLWRAIHCPEELP